MTEPRVWTNNELLAEAMIRGHSPTERLLSDWTGAGLLGGVKLRGVGRGSIPGVRSDNQAQLFFALLKHRRNVREIATLTNLPLYLWLHWGDEYVTVEQTRRALRTYAKHYRTSSGNKAAITARLHLEAFGLKKVPKQAKEELVKILTTLAVQPRSELGDLAVPFATALRNVIAPNGTRLDLPTVENLVWIINLRLIGLSEFADEGDEETFPDQAMEQARAVYRQNVNGYLATSRTPPAKLTEEVVMNACINFLTELARGLRGQIPPASPKAIPGRKP